MLSSFTLLTGLHFYTTLWWCSTPMHVIGWVHKSISFSVTFRWVLVMGLRSLTTMICFIHEEKIITLEKHHYSFHIDHCSIISPSRIQFPTSPCWHLVGVRGQLWVCWAPFIKWKRRVCWTLCSTWGEFLGQHGNYTFTHNDKFFH